MIVGIILILVVAAVLYAAPIFKEDTTYFILHLFQLNQANESANIKV